MGKVPFLGRSFDDQPITLAAEEILANLDGAFRYVVTPNAHHVVRLFENHPVVKSAFDGAWRTYCDSRIIQGLARLRGHLMCLVTGSDLTAALIREAALRHVPIAIVGPPREDIQILQARYPELEVTHTCPPMGFIESKTATRDCVDFVVRSNTRLIFLAVGMPQQEILACRIAQHSEARGVGLCIGASIDFLTGRQRRAPAWMRRLGLEWLHRFISNPRRLARRYFLESPKIFYIFVREWIETRRAAA